MKYFKTVVFLMFLGTSFPVLAQIEPSTSLDVGMWGYASEESFGSSSWNMLYVGDNLFEVRHNFDNTNTLSLYYGKRLHLGEVSITPALGFLQSPDYSAIGVTTHLSYENDKLKFYSINQGNKGTVPGGGDIIYHWIDFSYKITPWLNVGCSDQYYSIGDFDNFDVGPSVGVSLGDFYAKVYGWDLWSEEDRYTGLWCGWYFEF